MVKRVLVGYGIDVDAVSGWLAPGAGATNVSRGVFGATVGVDRLLKLWDKYGIKTTWFVPAHSIESFPSQMAKVRDAGHEIGLHGYTHEHVSTLSEQQERDVLAKSIEVLTALTGKKPKGWTAPAWDTSKSTVKLLEEFGIVRTQHPLPRPFPPPSVKAVEGQSLIKTRFTQEYDHSFMYHDSQMYYLPDGSHTWKETKPNQPKAQASEWMTPMSALNPSSVVEVPANWHLDDWPPMQPFGGINSHGYVDPHMIERLWKEQFDFLYREYDTFVFPISIHPQVSGKPQVILMHERLIEYINSHEGVEWCTMEQMVAEFKAGRMGNTTVEGGANL